MSAKPRSWWSSVALALALAASLAFFAATARTDRTRRASLSDADAGVLASAVWAGVRGEKFDAVLAHAPEATHVVAAFHSLRGNPAVPPMVAVRVGPDVVADIRSAALRASRSLTGTADAVSIHLIENPGRLWWEWPASKGWGYERGLDGLIRCDEGRCVTLPAVIQHARSMSFAGAKSALEKTRGASLPDPDLSDGLFTFHESAWISDGPGRALPLFRASVPLESVDAESILQACRLGGDFLVRVQRPDGRWYYEYEPGRDRLEPKAYNLLRHAGTTYSLIQLFAKTGDERYMRAADEGLRYLRTTIEADPDDPKRLYVREHQSIKLGGAGLALMAFVEKAKVRSLDAEETRVVEGLVRHCLLAQNPDGSFASYHAARDAKAKKRRSIYYPGEAMLGLIRYHQIHPERADVLRAVQKAAAYLADDRWRMLGIEFNVPPDAWLMLALEELHEADPDPRWAEYCFRIGRGMGFEQLGAWWGLDYAGGYYPTPPQVTPAGSRSEGLTAAWLLADRVGDRETADALKRTIATAARFQIDRMIRPEFAALYRNPERALGVFRHSAVSNLTRIDYNQHNISGLLVAADILSR